MPSASRDAVGNRAGGTNSFSVRWTQAIIYLLQR